MAWSVANTSAGWMTLRLKAGIGTAATSRPCVIGREYAADKGDDGEGVAPIVAYRIDIPPGIAAGRNLPVEARSASTASAAKRPDNAAIGTPGPGCTLPPAK